MEKKIKTKELMIGDVIKTYHGYEIVSDIYTNSIFTKDGLWEGEEFEEGEFEPVPLTEKILETNGWVFCDDCEYASPFDLSFKTSLRIFGFGEYYDEGRFAVNIGYEQLRNNLKYVHELQNLIRSLGMSEIANNFKIV